MTTAFGQVLLELDAGLYARIAPALADHLWELVERAGIEQSAADGRRFGARAATASRARLEHLLTPLTPGIILGLATILPVSDRQALIGGLLLHRDCLIREQTLDAISDPAAGAASVQRLCAALSQRLARTVRDRSNPLPAGSDFRDVAVSSWEAFSLPERSATAVPTQTLSLVQALRNGAHATAIAIVAERACLPVRAVEQAIRMRDARMLIALCRRAGCDTVETIAVETQLGRISPEHALQVGPGPGWPVSGKAMDWSIGILQEML